MIISKYDNYKGEFTLTKQQITELLKSHTSIRQYKSTPIHDDELKEMIHAAQHASSSNFIQAYSIIRIRDTERKKLLTQFASNKQQILSAPVVLIFCADLKRVEYACQKHDVQYDEHNLENFIVSVVDTALLAQNFATAAEAKGYGLCYIGGVRNNPEQISELVGLPDQVFPLFGMTVGVPDEQQWVKPRLPVEAILHDEHYDEEKYEEILHDYDELMNKYYKERLTNTKDSNWSKSMAEFLKDPRRDHMEAFIRSKGFKF